MRSFSIVILFLAGTVFSSVYAYDSDINDDQLRKNESVIEKPEDFSETADEYSAEPDTPEHPVAHEDASAKKVAETESVIEDRAPDRVKEEIAEAEEKPAKRDPVYTDPPAEPAGTPVKKERGYRKAVYPELLSIDDGNFLYKRIPGIIIDTPAPRVIDAEQIFSERVPVINNRVENDSGSDSENSGLLGLSGSATDLLVKIFFVVLLIIIIIIYRTRANQSSGTVLKRIPKK